MCEEDLLGNEDDYYDGSFIGKDADDQSVRGSENMAIEEVEENEEGGADNTQ